MHLSAIPCPRAEYRRQTTLTTLRDGSSKPLPYFDSSGWDIRGVTSVAQTGVSEAGHGRCGVSRGSNSRDDLVLTWGNLSGASGPSRFSQRSEIPSCGSRRPRRSPWILPRGRCQAAHKCRYVRSSRSLVRSENSSASNAPSSNIKNERRSPSSMNPHFRNSAMDAVLAGST